MLANNSRIIPAGMLVSVFGRLDEAFKVKQTQIHEIIADSRNDNSRRILKIKPLIVVMVRLSFMVSKELNHGTDFTARQHCQLVNN
jgi:hypothetical protein